MLRANLIKRFKHVRKQTEILCQPLAIEDYVIQAMADVSPPKWHLAHTSWFFETFILIPFVKNYPVFHPDYHYLFNSYYESQGSFFPREQRGLLARPGVEEIYCYRRHVDQHLLELLDSTNETAFLSLLFTLELGIQHEQQHQELLLMDIKYNASINPLRPAYAKFSEPLASVSPLAIAWQEFSSGLYSIGYDGPNFAFDNESPQHQVHLSAFKIRNRLVTNAEYLAFMHDLGYRRPDYWLSDGWQQVKQQHWSAPLYWEQREGSWWTMTLQGMRPLIMDQPVCHISFYEADAFARWAKARLPSEAEWEVAASQVDPKGNFLETARFHPQITSGKDFFGDVWEWTASAYAPYPGFRPFPGAFAEYNSKFACNQFVLRGGCIITPESHIRLSYRNFFYPHQRWPFTGIRLARDV